MSPGERPVNRPVNRPARVATPAVWSHPEMERAAALMGVRYGLVFPPTRRNDVDEAMRRAMDRRGITDPAKWSEIVAHGAEPLDDVISELTIGETYFFREPAQLDVVRNVVLPSAAMAHPRQPLRIWSAACATGEEAFSLAMLLRETNWPTDERPVNIVGTDLSVVRLAAARRGLYNDWALRGMPEERRDRFFARSGRGWQLDASIRSMVEFRLLNLAEDAYPEPATGIFGMDIIFCRNVLIYFDMQTVVKVAGRLINSLSDEGWLFLGASDPPIGDLVKCEVVTTPAGLAYRRADRRGGTGVPARAQRDIMEAAPTTRPAAPRAANAPLAPATLRPSVPKIPTIPTIPTIPSVAPAAEAPSPSSENSTEHGAEPALAAYREGRYADAVELARASVQRGSGSEPIWIAWVRALANEGRLLEAAGVCATALERYGTSAELTYMESVLLAQTGQHVESGIAARRALYLDRTMVVAHLALGDALAHSDDVAGALRSFRNAERILIALPEDATVRGTDGETVARLTQIARYRADALTDHSTR